MATQTSLVAQQVRIRQWAEQIRNCQNRPKGMDVETWCTQNNLTKANYYYRLRRVRQICLDQMQDTETTAFVELPAPAPDPKKTDTPKESGTCISAGTLPMIRIKASPQTWVLAMKNPRILRGLRRFYRNDQDH